MDEIGTIVPDLPVALEYVSTLEYFDGDLLTEFRGSDGGTHLMTWVDTDRETCSRWLVFAVTSDALEGYVAGKCSLRSLIFGSLGEDLYLVDLDSEHRRRRVTAVKRDELPASYLPSDDAYYDATLAPRK